MPTLPWSGTGVAVSFADCGGVIPDDVYARVRVCLHVACFGTTVLI